MGGSTLRESGHLELRPAIVQAAPPFVVRSSRAKCGGLRRLRMRIPISVVIVIAISMTTQANMPREGAKWAATNRGTQGPTEQTSNGYVVASTAGERLVYCGRPLVLNIKVDSKRAPGTRLIAGTAELRGDEGIATHRQGDEVIYVVRGSGHAILGDTRVSLEAGSVAFVPEGTSHRLRSAGVEPLEYVWVLGPRSSAESFRQAASVGCRNDALGPANAEPSSQTAAASATAGQQTGGGPGAIVVPPGVGERLVYCELPLVLTLKVESESNPVARLRAAGGVLRKGEERGVHRDADEVLYVVRGRGQAIIGEETIAVQPGSMMFVPQDTPHGMINASDEPLEYFVVHSPQASAAGFRRRAAVPGPHCSGRIQSE